LKELIILGKATHENADPLLFAFSWRNARVFPALPSNLQQNPLRRVYSVCIARGNAEKGRIKQVNIPQKSTAPACVLYPWAGPCIRQRTMKSLSAPAIRRDCLN
jgi:hypothetical protein